MLKYCEHKNYWCLATYFLKKKLCQIFDTVQIYTCAMQYMANGLKHRAQKNYIFLQEKRSIYVKISYR